MLTFDTYNKFYYNLKNSANFSLDASTSKTIDQYVKSMTYAILKVH